MLTVSQHCPELVTFLKTTESLTRTPHAAETDSAPHQPTIKSPPKPLLSVVAIATVIATCTTIAAWTQLTASSVTTTTGLPDKNTLTQLELFAQVVSLIALATALVNGHSTSLVMVFAMMVDEALTLHHVLLTDSTSPMITEIATVMLMLVTSLAALVAARHSSLLKKLRQ
jgi:hypothetical protein